MSNLPSVEWLVHESPFHSRREARPSSTSQTGSPQLAENEVGPFQDDLFRLVPVTLKLQALEELHAGFLPVTWQP